MRNKYIFTILECLDEVDAHGELDKVDLIAEAAGILEEEIIIPLSKGGELYSYTEANILNSNEELNRIFIKSLNIAYSTNIHYETEQIKVSVQDIITLNENTSYSLYNIQNEEELTSFLAGLTDIEETHNYTTEAAKIGEGEI